MKTGAVWVLIFLMLHSLTAQNKTAMESLSEHYPSYSSLPIALSTGSEGRIFLILKEGYLNLTLDFKADDQSLLSLYLTESEDWKTSRDVLVDQGQWLFVDFDNRLWEGQPSKGTFTLLKELERDYQRVLLVDRNMLLAFDGHWNILSRSLNWESSPFLGASALSIPLGYRNNTLWFYDPLAREFLSSEGVVLKSSPPPGSWILSGSLREDGFLLWDEKKQWLYDLKGEQVRSSPHREPGHFLHAQREDRFYRFYFEDLRFEYTRNEKVFQFQWDEDIEIDMYLHYLPELLERPIGENRKFLLWCLEKVKPLYLSHPLDRNLRDLKESIEIKLIR